MSAGVFLLGHEAGEEAGGKVAQEEADEAAAEDVKRVVYAQVHAAIAVEHYVQNHQHFQQRVGSQDSCHVLDIRHDELVRQALQIVHNHQERRGYSASVCRMRRRKTVLSACVAADYV